jgi:hypothetical protein
VSQGAGQKKTGDPRGGWVVQSTKKDQGQKKNFDIFYRVFELPSSRNAQKRDKRQIREKVGFGFLVEFFVKNNRHDLFCKTFFVVFLNSHRSKTPENAIKQKKSRKN